MLNPTRNRTLLNILCKKSRVSSQFRETCTKLHWLTDTNEKIQTCQLSRPNPSSWPSCRRYLLSSPSWEAWPYYNMSWEILRVIMYMGVLCSGCPYATYWHPPPTSRGPEPSRRELSPRLGTWKRRKYSGPLETTRPASKRPVFSKLVCLYVYRLQNIFSIINFRF